jgi:hypothetical protein
VVKIHTVLFAMCTAAVLACAGLSLPLLADTTPEACCSGPVAEPRSLPSPTAPPPAGRKAVLPHCLVGSWQVVTEERRVKFYTDVDPLPFVATSGVRYYEFRPDGTALERDVDFTMIGTHRGQELRWVRNGERTFTWSGTENTVTYHSLTATSLVVDYYDSRGRLNPWSESVIPDFNETDNISCSGAQVTESATTDSGYHATWQRTADFGVYG